MFLPGKYIVIVSELNIRPQMDTNEKPIGRYFNGDIIEIYKVFPEVVHPGESIIWGLNSQNENPPTRFVALKVNNNFKVTLKELFPIETPTDEGPVTRAEFNHLRSWAMIQGYKKP